MIRDELILILLGRCTKPKSRELWKHEVTLQAGSQNLFEKTEAV
jgi:hypothetical protein